MHASNIVGAIIGGGFGLIFLTALAIYVIARTLKYSMPVFKEIWQEYTRWKRERAMEDSEFMRVYDIYRRMNKSSLDDKEYPANKNYPISNNRS